MNELFKIFTFQTPKFPFYFPFSRFFWGNFARKTKIRVNIHLITILCFFALFYPRPFPPFSPYLIVLASLSDRCPCERKRGNLFIILSQRKPKLAIYFLKPARLNPQTPFPSIHTRQSLAIPLPIP